MSSGSWAFRIAFDPGALDNLKALHRTLRPRPLGLLRNRVATLTNPRRIGEPLSGARLGSAWDYRVGDRRTLCDIQDERIVVRVMRIGHRREVYR
jgi:mRNA interferase RelE/StbE